MTRRHAGLQAGEACAGQIVELLADVTGLAQRDHGGNTGEIGGNEYAQRGERVKLPLEEPLGPGKVSVVRKQRARVRGDVQGGNRSYPGEHQRQQAGAYR